MKHYEKKISEIQSYCMRKPGAYEARPFGESPICFKVMGKIFVQLHPNKSFYKVTLKCEPEQAELYRMLYPGILVRGYHCPPVQQPYWNTIDLDAFTDEQMLWQMIDEAYDAVVNKLTKKARAQLLQLSAVDYLDTDASNSDFVLLCEKLDQALDELVGGKNQRSQYNQSDSIQDVIVVYRDNVPVACGSYKMYDEGHAELKHIYVEPSCRGMGLGSELVRRLEAKAKIHGFQWCILETGDLLHAAHHIYKKLGYKVIPNYGQYADMTKSICMARKI